MDEPAAFEQLVQFRAPTNLSEAIERAARRRCQSKSDYIRQTLIDRLQTDGASPAAEQQYALVANGSVMLPRGDDPVTTFRPTPDDRGEWFPIENEDSQPFDPVLHWRLKPLPLRLDGERVVRVYPVVPKTMEYA
ncbi:hypothetical protein [Bradyrhizobium betae]|uniref:Uncharacterized protein n=1 Tax=Bradyrhizobium betae TaxID=244734 RepID=A0A4Q1V9V1_9BRAD|nr:hypothetical protein [Bradyrhizobium betae]RXT48751.1 hypothetical protein B5V03_12665 [Bradyrhizobium betae]